MDPAADAFNWRPEHFPYEGNAFLPKKLDFGIYVFEASGSITLLTLHRSQVISATSVERFVREFEMALERIIHDPNATIAP